MGPKDFGPPRCLEDANWQLVLEWVLLREARITYPHLLQWSYDTGKDVVIRYQTKSKHDR
jgi:hypothetical protein